MANNKRRGGWSSGGPIPVAPAQPTAFELLAEQLKLTERMYTNSEPLHVWCKLNKNRCYIPEWLLRSWDIAVDSDQTI
jgi:hypothetical protein